MIRDILLGAVWGSMYAFVSYYLLSPGSGNSLIQITYWAVNGIIFMTVYSLITFSINRFNLVVVLHKNMIFKPIIGAISGILTGGISIYYNYKVILSTHRGSLPIEYKKMMATDLIHILLGFLLFGLLIGVIFRLKTGKK